METKKKLSALDIMSFFLRVSIQVKGEVRTIMML